MGDFSLDQLCNVFCCTGEALQVGLHFNGTVGWSAGNLVVEGFDHERSCQPASVTLIVLRTQEQRCTILCSVFRFTVFMMLIFAVLLTVFTSHSNLNVQQTIFDSNKII